MGNKIQTCCSDTKDTNNEILRDHPNQENDEDNIMRAKANRMSNDPAPFIEQKSHEIFEDKEISAIKNQANDTPNQFNGNFNTDSLDPFHKTQFRPDENMISNFLVGGNDDFNKCLPAKVLASRETVKEKYIQNFSEELNSPEFTGDNIVELPPVFLDREKKNEIYKGSWFIEKKEILEGEDITNLNSHMKFHGYGVLLKKDNSVQEGIFRNGYLEGPGKTYLQNGDTFIGNFEKGLLNNRGIFVDSQGDIYEGEFKENIMEGHGQEKFIDESYFVGEYSNNKKNGKGKFVWKDGSFYEGELKDNHFDGYGIYEWASGLKYQGNWKKGLMQGEGIITTKNGDYYEGGFENNKKDGFGLFWWNENKYYLGYWKAGVQHGQGKFCKEGKKVIGVWENGKIKGKLKEDEVQFPNRKFGKEISF